MGFLKRLVGLEARGAQVAHPRDPVLADWLATPNTATGLRVTPTEALRCPAVYAPIRLLSGTVSILPLDVFRRTGADTRERDTANPLHDLVHSKPNPWQTSAQFRRLMTERMLGYGKAYARIRNPGLPAALEPMHPARVKPFRDRRGALWYRHTPKDGPAETLAAHEVLHLRYGPAEDDEGLDTLSPIELHRETIGLAMAATAYLARFFGNSAVPKGAIEVPAALSDKAAEALRASWERRHQGLENAHRLAILDGGMKFHELGMSNADAQFLESYRHVSSEVASKVFGVPPHLVGDTEKSTSWGSGIEQQSIGYVVHVVQPILEEWEQALDAALLTPDGRRSHFFEFNVDGLLRGDFKTRMEGMAMAVQWGLMTPNEARRLLNLPALEGGDSRLQPLNMAPAEAVLDVLLKPQASAARLLRAMQGLDTTPDLEPAHV